MLARPERTVTTGVPGSGENDRLGIRLGVRDYGLEQIQKSTWFLLRAHREEGNLREINRP